MSLKNWQQFKWPYESLKTFTDSEPFPSEEMKATYIGDRPKKKGAKLYHQILLDRKKKQGVR